MKKLIDIQQISKDLYSAIVMKQPKVYLQPRYSLLNGRVVGAEAVLRWTHPEYGPILPCKLLPMIDNTALSIELDHYLWDEVCKILRKWDNEGMMMLPISVSISRVSMNSSMTIPYLRGLIKKNKVNTSYVYFELPESVCVEDTAVTRKNIQQLQKLGFKVILDNFGSGNSSLSVLRDLPADMLKINMDLVPTNDKGSRGKIILFSVINMCNLLNIPIIVEDVEKKEQAELLVKSGCEFVQGTYYSKPLRRSDYEEYVNRSENLEQFL